MKKVKANIFMYEVSKLKQHNFFFLKELNDVLASPFPSAKASLGKGKLPDNTPNKIYASNTILIGDHSNYHTPPLLLTFEIFNKNVDNSLIDLGTSSNIMPYSVSLKLDFL